ncbi:ATP-binding protein [Actinosynnema pretiosum]|uniref:ATP-binding protein n=1 Tax=Actinosynnema pretiosum TaxID=42197 RepID=UPI0012FD0197|nr:ATP-binding protein [Actinosynnema pretiosum]
MTYSHFSIRKPTAVPTPRDGRRRPHLEPGRTTGRVEVDASLRCENLGAVRARVTELLAGHDRDFVDDVRLVANELAANACDHAEPPRTLVLRREVHDERGAELVVEVSDASPERSPLPGTSTLGEFRGNGIRMVQALCADWGVRRGPDVKVVWARMPFP